MKINSEISHFNQKGASVFATLMVVVLIGLVAMSGLKLAPAYMDDNVIVGSIEAMDEETGLSEMNLREIRLGVSRFLIANGIRDFDLESIQILDERGGEYLAVNYESRAALFYNIEAVVVFSHRFDL